VLDTVLADRIRSQIGPLEHSLDTPRVHVMVEHDVAILHGDVPTIEARRVIETAVRGVDGVRGVVSHLNVGLLSGDTRPSDAETEPSHARRRLVAAARRAAGGDATADVATDAVLRAFGATLSPRARRRITSHLPADVALHLEPLGAGPITSLESLYGMVADACAAPAAHVPWIVSAVLTELRSLVPGEVGAVAQQLRGDLRHEWETEPVT
jgi:uncharacterized protein (DUF2267 family)